MNRVFLSLLLLFTLNTAFAQTKDERLFHIVRNKDKDIVCYDICLKNGVVNKDKPINVYWRRAATGRTDELSAIQFRLAFGFVVNNTGDKDVLFTMKAYDKRPIKAVYDEEQKKYYAQIIIDGKLSRLEKLSVFANPPLYVSVPYIELYGKDVATGCSVYERINNK